MKQILFFCITCIICHFAQGQNLKISSPILSPKKDKIVFSIYSGSNVDIYTYHFVEDTIVRATNSTELNSDYQYKSFFNWLDNDRILFISKHGNGIAQQWILDLSKNTLEPNGYSLSNEYFLRYSPLNEESYYISSLNGKEPAVYRRKLYSSKFQKVTKKNINHIGTNLSPKFTYLTFKEMPLGTLLVYSLIENKYIKTTLPPKNVSILSWSPKEDKFIYSQGYFLDNNSAPKHSIFEYDIELQKSNILFKDLDFVYDVIWNPCETKYLYSSLNELYVKDIISSETQKFDVIGEPICWFENCFSILFKTDKQLFIFNIDTREIKMIIDLN
ncbi:hypothetical protein LJC11_05010 [Bacteroidales bacterium OttesenSCG-928-I21]|nr:hypothetical protein [Bacteroidales bacterium OttesenSCG-928-I21]